LTSLYCNVCGQLIPQERIKGWGAKWPKVCSDPCKNAYRQLKRDARALARVRIKEKLIARQNAAARVRRPVQEIVE
jgi:hypothetical protein